MGAATVITRVLAQIEKFLDIKVPGFEIRAYSPLALATLIDRHSGVIDHLEEGNHTLAFAIGALDMATQRTHRRPVVADSTGKLLQQGIFLDRLENTVQIIGYRRQIAGRQLRMQRAAIEQRRRGTHEIKA